MHRASGADLHVYPLRKNRQPGTVETESASVTSRQSQESSMGRGPRPRGFRLRVVFALAVIVLLVVELTSRRYRLAGIVQLVLIVAIIVASIVDIRDMFHKNRS